MSLKSLKRKLEEMRRGRAGAPTSLESIIYKQTRCPRSHIYIPDPLIDLPDFKEVELFLELDKTDELPFVVDKWDCDNYAGVLYGKFLIYALTNGKNWGFGICESDRYGGHRFNIVVVKPRRVLFIEPQNDSFFTKTGKFKFILL